MDVYFDNDTTSYILLKQMHQQCQAIINDTGFGNAAQNIGLSIIATGRQYYALFIAKSSPFSSANACGVLMSGYAAQ